MHLWQPCLISSKNKKPHINNKKHPKRLLTSITQNAIDAVFASPFVFVQDPPFHFVFLVVVFGASSKFAAQNATD